LKKVTQILYSGLGGPGSVFFSLVEAEKQIGTDIKHHALFFGIEPLIEDYKDRCNSLGVAFNYIRKGKGFDIKSQYFVYKALKKIAPDVVILHSPQNIFACYLYKKLKPKCKLLVVEHQANALKSKKLWWLSWCVLKLADGLVYLSDIYKFEVEKRFPNLVKKANCKVIPNGINLGVFHPIRGERQFNFTLGMASRLTPNKDHITLVNALSLLKHKSYFNSLKLCIAGNGTETDRIKQSISSLGLADNVKMLGLLGEDDLAEFYRGLDIYVQASYGETMSTSIMQAQATGLPIIASDVKGINSIIEHNKNGLLYKLENALDLAEKIDALVMNEDLRSNLAAKSLQYAYENLSAVKMWRKYELLF